MPAIVTGGSSGLGRAAALTFGAAGARIAIFDLDDDRGARTAQESEAFFRVDVTHEQSVADGIAAAAETFGTARVLVNCAGIAPAAKTVGKDKIPHARDTCRCVIAVNLVGTFAVISWFAAAIAATDKIAGERGMIVGTASIAAYDGQIGQVAYSAFKGGVVGMTLPLARDLASHEIRVMAIATGIFLKAMPEALSQAVQNALGAQILDPACLGRPGKGTQLVEAIVRNPMLNGEVIRLGGAIRMAPR